MLARASWHIEETDYSVNQNHGEQQQQPRQQVQVTLSLRTSAPHTISIGDADPAEPLKLIASIRQTASPFPDRAITLLTKYSCLDATPGEDAFFWRAMSPPKFTRSADDKNHNALCPAPELPLQPPQRISGIRVSGDPDLLKRPTDGGFTFITVPPVGKGQAEVTTSSCRRRGWSGAWATRRLKGGGKAPRARSTPLPSAG
ncbi:hypothetical protein NUW58_g5576 [Xylaria curta]|uniref:Uncharacterized protein n=1 Tax=Xylaria curta TaxID=42375 RepID=A0ACC1P2J8_9PEZI|nr:hypothetical protein NUW58_g5576 [Xylaria curta]